MPQTPLEQSLRDLARTGTLVKDRGYRQVWRFEHEGKAYYLKFYRRSGFRDALRRFFRGSPAGREFYRLQWLQKAGINAPRAVACLMGFKLAARGTGGGAVDGDAVILEAIEPSVPLEEVLSEREAAGLPVPEHRDLAGQVIALVHNLGKAKLGHDDLHLGNFLLHEGKVFLIDAYAVRKGGLRMADVMQLGASVSRFATRSDLIRGWRALGGGERPPEENPVGLKLWRDLLWRTRGDNRYFGHLEFGAWRGVFFRQTKHPRRWSAASRLTITEANWQQAWPGLIAQIEADTVPVLKRSRSADVLGAGLQLGGTTLDVIIKRPIRRYWYRYLNEVGRGARARRAWFKAWDLIVRDLPTAWPLAFFEKRNLGYVTDTLIVFERVPGPTLWTIDLDAMAPDERDQLFRRTGRVLRQLERVGFSHFDAKSSNWIVRPDAVLGASPVLIDVDGVRRRHWVAVGIRRLLRSMREKEQYTPEDSLALCQGYAPFTRVQREAPCPKCGYDLGDDPAETCPKCRERVHESQGQEAFPRRPVWPNPVQSSMEPGMMDESRFWQLIQSTRARALAKSRPKTLDIIDVHIETLAEELSKLTPDEIAAFASRFHELSARAYRWELWGAAYWIGGGCSDDGFTDFRATLISLGQDVYTRALSDPDSLADTIGAPDTPYFQSEGFQYVARKVYAKLTGRELPDDILPSEPKKPAGARWDFEDEEEMAERLPRIVAKLPEMGD